MASWDSYTQKATPEDNDTLMIKDTAAGANKRTPFSGVWNWMLNKLANAVISQLETSNKSIIPAINELNSNCIKSTVRIQNLNDLFELDPGVYIHRFMSYDAVNTPNGYSGFVITHVHNGDNGSQWIFNLQSEIWSRIKSSSGIGEWNNR